MHWNQRPGRFQMVRRHRPPGDACQGDARPPDADHEPAEPPDIQEAILMLGPTEEACDPVTKK
jgi:hypothetical protein